MKVFLDNNIIIDLLHEKRDGHNLATNTVNIILKKRYQIVITPLSITNAHYILSSHYKVSDSLKRLEALTKLGSISILNEPQVKLSFQNKWKDFEDSLQYQSAIKANCDCIITSDKKGFKLSTIEVFTPIKFIEEHKI